MNSNGSHLVIGLARGWKGSWRDGQDSDQGKRGEGVKGGSSRTPVVQVPKVAKE